MSLILIITVPKVVFGTRLAIIQNIFTQFPGNMLSAGNKVVSKTNAVLALKKLSVKWKAQTRYLAMKIKSDAF